jgi:hypothetical protein
MSERDQGQPSRLPWRRVVFLGLALALVLEIVSIGARFGLGLESTQATLPLAAATFGLRIHHGYLGFILGLIAWVLFQTKPAQANALWILAIGLVVSDLVHHFLVLWPITGSPQFDLFYPG